MSIFDPLVQPFPWEYDGPEDAGVACDICLQPIDAQHPGTVWTRAGEVEKAEHGACR